MFAPIFSSNSNIPVRSGFKPIFFIKTSDPLLINAPTIKNAADDISDGIFRFFP